MLKQAFGLLEPLATTRTVIVSAQVNGKRFRRIGELNPGLPRDRREY